MEQLAQLRHPAELELIRLMASWPRIVESAALAYEPHRVAFYLQELAAAFHGLWNLGNSENALRFIQKSAIDLTAARLALVRAMATVIAVARFGGASTANLPGTSPDRDQCRWLCSSPIASGQLSRAMCEPPSRLA